MTALPRNPLLAKCSDCGAETTHYVVLSGPDGMKRECFAPCKTRPCGCACHDDGSKRGPGVIPCGTYAAVRRYVEG
jgi:hypothetical protein